VSGWKWAKVRRTDQNILGPVSTESAEPRTGSFIDLSSEIDHSIETSLAKFFETSQPPEILPRRGAKEAKLYREVSPGIVLIIAGEDTLGSGSIISSDGLVLTNWHVVRGQKKVVVVFKPPRGSEIREQDVFIAIVVKIDEIADLALAISRRQRAHLHGFRIWIRRKFIRRGYSG